MRLHVVGLPHTETTREFVTCAYTQKLVKFGRMMTDHGVDVVIYSGSENDAPCVEHVELFTRDERESWFGQHDRDTLWGHVGWDPESKPWLLMNARATEAIVERADPDDLVLLTAGQAQRPLTQIGLTACEWAVGYEGITSPFCAFESHAWRHYVYAKRGIADGRWYDTVIPNFFDAADFDEPKRGSGYLLFVGRLIGRKGPHVAAEIARAAGRRLVVAGPGAASVEPGRIVCHDGTVIEGDVEYAGVVDAAGRAALMRDADALLAPTLYVEPFGGVAVEAMLAGTPAITTDWGAFTETVEDGVTGFRFATLADGVAAVERADTLEPADVHERAAARFSLEAVTPLFEAWFDRLGGLRRGGWNELRAAV